MAHYIKAHQLRIAQLKDFVTDEHLSLVDLDLETMAMRKSVTASDIETDPLDHLLTDLCIAYLGKRVAMEKMGINPQAYSNGVESDVYLLWYETFRKDATRIESMVTAEMFLGEADTQQERSSEIELNRG